MLQSPSQLKGLFLKVRTQPTLLEMDYIEGKMGDRIEKSKAYSKLGSSPDGEYHG